MRARLPLTDQIGPDVPLRLAVPAALAFPDGSMTASGLRREASRGRLVIERIAGKDYTQSDSNLSHRPIQARTGKIQGKPNRLSANIWCAKSGPAERKMR